MSRFSNVIPGVIAGAVTGGVVALAVAGGSNGSTKTVVTTEVSPTASVLPVLDVMRADDVRPGLSTEELEQGWAQLIESICGEEASSVARMSPRAQIARPTWSPTCGSSTHRRS